MMPGAEGPGLRERISTALDELTWNERVESLLVLMDDYAAEQAEIGYRQGRESAKRTGREDVLRALSNFAEGQLVMALDETNLDARRGRLFVIEMIWAVIQVEQVRP